MRRIARAGLATIIALTTACGGGSTRPGVASTGGTTTTRTRPPSGPHANQSQQLQLAQCMRSHGVPNFPDPSATGGQLQNILRAGINTQSAAYRAALQACEQYTPAGSSSPSERAADEQAGLRFSACMRSHGVPDFPDPSTGPTGAPVINLAPEHIDPDSPTVRAADQACSRIIPSGK
jgi:hypothetical protein